MHSFGCPIVVITSASLTDFDSSLLTLIASFHGTKFFLKFPKISGSFTGTGDLLASLILARVTKSSDRFVFLKAVEKAISTMHAILMKTTGDNCRDRELKLIQSKREIEDPEILFQGEWIL